MTSWIDIGALEDIPSRGARVVKTAEGCVAVFRTHDDQVFALDDRCPHKGGHLSDGLVHGHSVTCPLHSWVIGLNDGMAKGADEGAVRTHPARIEGGRVLLDVSAVRAGRAA